MRRLSKDEALEVLDAERARMPANQRACAMCTLARLDWEPPLIIACNEAAVLRLNRIPSRPNEMMVLLREHKEKVSEVSASAYASMFALAHRAAAMLERKKGALRVFVAQLGAPEDVRVSYPHLHVHVLPLYESGEAARPSRVFSWSEIVYGYEPGEAELVAAALRASLAD